MSKLSFIELIIRGIPEAFLLIWACYVLSKTKVDYKKFILSSLGLATISYLGRFLPISFGINTVIIIAGVMFFNIKINKIPNKKTIQVTIFTFALEFMCEVLNVLVIKFVFKSDLNYIFSDPILKTIYGIPSLVFFAFFIFIINIFFIKKKTGRVQLTE